jgi:hypothetical protein
VPKHRHFEELCALAALGDLPPEQSRELEAHLAACPECAPMPADYLQVRNALGLMDAATEAKIAAGRDRVRAAIMLEISQIEEERAAAPSRTSPHVRPWTARVAPPIWLAASAATAAGIFLLGLRFDRALHPPPPGPVAAVPSRPIAVPANPQFSSVNIEQRALEARNAELADSLRKEQDQNRALEAKLSNDDQDLANALALESSLRQEIDQQAALVKSTQADLGAKKTELAQAQAANVSDLGTIASMQLQVRDLNERLNTQTASLDRERDLLSHGREIRDIIGARNLHIIDVYDTDTAGATAKPFARAFYTEGKSLVYYAYDLPQRKAEEGQFSYVAWGEANGNKASIKKIGILFHDDQTQRRWSLSFSDSQVLKEIDSVFITLEPNGEDVNQPKGKRMLTAYLGTPANHP